jgi:putative transposase
VAIGYLLTVHAFSVRRSCHAVGVSRAAYYRNLCLERREDRDVITALNALVEKHSRWGFWKCFKALRRKKHPWNHKRVYRVYCGLRLNQKRRAKKRIPQRLRQPLTVPGKPNEVWSADFMSDALYGGSRFRTFNVIDDFNRESLAVEIDTSITGTRLIRIFQRLQKERGLPLKLRTDNGPEFLSADFVTWAEAAGMTIQYIQKGEPNQNAYIERFNRTYREEVLSLYLFEDLRQVREATYWWRIDYNESRPHDALGDRTPAECLETQPENSTLELST